MAADDVLYLTAPVCLTGQHLDTSLYITVRNPTDAVLLRDLVVTGSITVDASSQVTPSPFYPQYPQHAGGIIPDGAWRPVHIVNVTIGEWHKPPRSVVLISCVGATLERVKRLGPDTPAGCGVLIYGGGIATWTRLVDCNIHNAQQGLMVATWVEGLTVDTCHFVDCEIGVNISDWPGVTGLVPAGCYMLNIVGSHMHVHTAGVFLKGVDVGWLDRLFILKVGSALGLQIDPSCTRLSVGSIMEQEL